MSSLFSFRLARARKEQAGVGVGKRKGADLRGAHVPVWRCRAGAADLGDIFLSVASPCGGSKRIYRRG
jgi:hypothetical protein